MVDLDAEQRVMLDEALAKARHLVAELEKQKKEIDAAPPPPKDIDPEKFAEGRHAMIKAIASARRMLVSLEEAERMADAPDDEGHDDRPTGTDA